MSKSSTRPEHPQISIWDACGEAKSAETNRWVKNEARLKEAATQLSFTKVENGKWEHECPHCGGIVILSIPHNSIEVRYRGPCCDAIPTIQQWLRDGGFA